MDIKKVPTNTITRDTRDLVKETGNLYETVVILSKRANQISLAEKKEIAHKLEEFKSERDTMEEQIEISMYYERLPKPDLIAISEYQNGELVFRKAHSDENNK